MILICVLYTLYARSLEESRSYFVVVFPQTGSRLSRLWCGVLVTIEATLCLEIHHGYLGTNPNPHSAGHVTDCVQ